MRQRASLKDQLKSHGFVDGSDFVDLDETPYDDMDLEMLHERDLWSFQAGDNDLVGERHYSTRSSC